MATKPKNIDQYIKDFPTGAQKMLQQIRTAVKKAAPAAEETISYDIPGFKLNQRGLISFAGWKEHVSIYPVPRNEALQKEISVYQTGKGTLRFPLDKPLPMKLISRIVKSLVIQNTERAKAKKK